MGTDDKHDENADKTTLVNMTESGRHSKIKRLIPVVSITAGAEQGRVISLLAQPIIQMGRAKDVQLSLPDPSCSRKHAQIWMPDPNKPDEVFLKDMGSTNGTKLNGEKIKADTRLKDADRIQVGDNTILKISWVPEDEVQAQMNVYKQATRDPLTGAFNRNRFNEALSGELSFQRRQSGGLGIIMFDVDHFKKCNDTFGHLAGDEVLRCIGNRVPNLIRTEDTFARIGGEEFAIIVRNTDESGINILAERIRAAMEKEPASFEGRGIPFTISVGVTVLADKSPIKPDALMQTADEALYAAKHGGRNRVVFKAFGGGDDNTHSGVG